ncbi:CAP domain-containing protein [Citreimonas salinaria]|uniref:Cysteine-rich secretory protein family protein n=1 Tax=Citreimonas salinaria TaxID=321339 RepID=A0A1H3K4A6_9RHOB|nr:CAP domain-containing protein [Citreimonas salinaria]SDY46991.1 Cysteine-rich secretory protein family protein [Citreimonas salinaria]
MTSPSAIFRLALVAVCMTTGPAAAQEPGDLERLRQHALDLVNEARREEGLSELRLGSDLNEAAQTHAADMLERDYHAHVAPDGETPRDRFLAAGGSRWALSGENIAMCSGCAPPPDIERVATFHEGWMQSREHRAAILSEGFDQFGFGVSGEGNEIYAVQTFAGRGNEADDPDFGVAEARATALEGINARRKGMGLDPLEASVPLDAAADRLLEKRLSGEAPENAFELLPEESTGWTSMSILSASRGGAGSLSEEAMTGIVDDWADQGADTAFGGARATHLGFAVKARDEGRTTAVAILGGRG